MSDEMLVVERRDDGVAVVRLNRAEARNALSNELRARTTAAFRELAAEHPAVRAIVLTGNGPAFSAGVDLKELGGEVTVEARWRDADQDMVGAIRACPQPVIAAVNGVAVTGGFELALACDILVASSAARFADTHARVGILPTWGITQRLPRLVGMARAKQLSFTGNFLDAATAERWGLVSMVVEPADLEASALRMAADIASNDPRAVANLKRAYDDGNDGTFADGLKVEREASRRHMASVSPADVAARRADVQARNRAQ